MSNDNHFIIAIIIVILYLGSNMPCTPEAVDVLRKSNVLIAPAVAAGAGGVRLLSLQFMLDRYARIMIL